MCIEALAVSLSPGCFLEPWLYTGAVHGCV